MQSLFPIFCLFVENKIEDKGVSNRWNLINLYATCGYTGTLVLDTYLDHVRIKRMLPHVQLYSTVLAKSEITCLAYLYYYGSDDVDGDDDYW